MRTMNGLSTSSLTEYDGSTAHLEVDTVDLVVGGCDRDQVLAVRQVGEAVGVVLVADGDHGRVTGRSRERTATDNWPAIAHRRGDRWREPGWRLQLPGRRRHAPEGSRDARLGEGGITRAVVLVDEPLEVVDAITSVNPGDVREIVRALARALHAQTGECNRERGRPGDRKAVTRTVRCRLHASHRKRSRWAPSCPGPLPWRPASSANFATSSIPALVVPGESQGSGAGQMTDCWYVRGTAKQCRRSARSVTSRPFPSSSSRQPSATESDGDYKQGLGPWQWVK